MKSAARAPDLLAVLTSVSTEKQALDLAHALVQRRLAACVNVLPVARSIFRWKGRVQQDSEFLLLIKTLEANFEAVRAAIKELNAYELPEIVGLPASKVDAAFAAWVAESSTGVPSDDDEDDESGEATID
ncbi:MAG TPA: divalent-cation tolerance protein CutA [Thermoanaerobaculia bacterium]|nr:divalent-cation tolerance protein CutA [Thermoanaerobaculia bacterium]